MAISRHSVIFNALPFQFPYNSPYCLIPFYTPQTIKSILKDIGKAKDYDLQRPTAQPRLLTIKSFEACKQAFLDRDTFRVFCRDHHVQSRRLSTRADIWT